MLKLSFVHKCILKNVIEGFCFDLPRSEGSPFSREIVEGAANRLF